MPDGTTVLQGGRSKRGKLRGVPGSKDWATTLKNSDDPLFLDFIKRCLDWDPSTRMTPSQALRHSWLRRRLPKPPSENPPPSRRSSAAYRNNNTMPKLQNGTNVLNNSSNITNTVNNININNNPNSNGNPNVRNNAAHNQINNNNLTDAEISKHTKLPKILNNGSNNNVRTGS